MRRIFFSKKTTIILLALTLLIIFGCIMFYRTAYDNSKIDLLLHRHIQATELKENSPEDTVYEVHKLLGENSGYFIQTKYIYTYTKVYNVRSKSYSEHLFPIKVTLLKLGNKVNIISSYVPGEGEFYPKGLKLHFPKEVTDQLYNNENNIANDLSDKMKKLQIQ